MHDEDFGEYVPVKPYDPRTGRTRRRRRPVAVLVSLLVLAGLIVGIVLGGQKLLTLIDPTSRDYTGQGTGAIDIRVSEGDTLSDIARTLVDAGVIASVGPFVQAAEANADSVGIQPGVYGLRQQMSGQAALDLMLDPAARRLSRVTLPEGLTVAADAGPPRRGDRTTGGGVPGRGRGHRRPGAARLRERPRSRASSSRPPTTSSPTTRRRTSSARWSPGRSRCSTSCRSRSSGGSRS